MGGCLGENRNPAGLDDIRSRYQKKRKSAFEKPNAAAADYMSDSSRRGVYLFVSIDIMNSTQFKTTNECEWPAIFEDFYKSGRANFCKDTSLDMVFWKAVGDELLFYKQLREMNELLFFLKRVLTAAGSTYKTLVGQHREIENRIYIKPTLFIAEVELNEKANRNYCVRTRGMYCKAPDEKKCGSKPCNYEVSLPNNIMLRYRSSRDFLGAQIDEGLRLCKYAAQKKLTVDPKIIYLIKEYCGQENFDELYSKLHSEIGSNKYKSDFEDQIKLVGYIELKGAWLTYPLIWYCEEWDADAVRYDEKVDYGIFKNYRELINGENQLEEIKKIVCDTNLKSQCESIKNCLEKSDYDNISNKNEAETHVSVVCFHKEHDSLKVYLVQRSSTREYLKNRWEFGCVKLTNDEPVEESAKKQFESKFHVNPEFRKYGPQDRQQLVTVGCYDIYRELKLENDTIIHRGICLMAECKTETNEKPDGEFKECGCYWYEIEDARRKLLSNVAELNIEIAGKSDGERTRMENEDYTSRFIHILDKAREIYEQRNTQSGE